MSDLFKEVIPSILKTKKHVVSSENEKDYVPFVVNKALSFHYDCVVWVNQMNLYPNTDKLMQYHYLMGRVRGYNRKFEKWQKLEEDKDFLTIKEYYNCSNEKAREYLSILTKDQIAELSRRLFKGGSGRARK